MKRITLILIALILFVSAIYSQTDMTLELQVQQTLSQGVYFYSTHTNDHALHLYGYSRGADSISVSYANVDENGILTPMQTLMILYSDVPYDSIGGWPYFLNGFYQNGMTFMIFKNEQYFYVFYITDDLTVETAQFPCPATILNFNGASMFLQGERKVWFAENGDIYLMNLQTPATATCYMLFQPPAGDDYYHIAPMGTNYVYAHESVQTNTAHDYLIDVNTLTWTAQYMQINYSLGTISPDLGNDTYLMYTGWSLDWDYQGYAYYFNINGNTWTSNYLSTWGEVNWTHITGENWGSVIPLSNLRFIAVCGDYNNIAGNTKASICILVNEEVLHEATFPELLNIVDPYEISKISDDYYVAINWNWSRSASLQLINMSSEEISDTYATNYNPGTIVTNMPDKFFYVFSSYTGAIVQVYNIVPVTAVPEEAIPASIVSITSYPNPFVERIALKIKGARKRIASSLEIYDIKGRLIRTINLAPQDNTEAEIWWDGKDNNGQTVSSGIYLSRFRQGTINKVNKLLKY